MGFAEMKIRVHVIGEKEPIVRDATKEEEAAIVAGYTSEREERRPPDVASRLDAIEARLAKAGL